jgi:hypothetical protein
MLFQASRAVAASSEMSRFISVSEYGAPSPSLLILACIETLGANSGANQLQRAGALAGSSKGVQRTNDGSPARWTLAPS